MKKQSFLFGLTVLFTVLTFCGAGYVLYSRGQVNAGFAVVPMALQLACLALYRAEQTRRK